MDDADTVKGRRRLLRTGLVLVALPAALVCAAAALGAASLADPTGDNNAAPDVTAMTVTESAGLFTIAVTMANYESLPMEGWVNVWFDLDNNSQTGDSGDEALLQYFDDGGIVFYRWDGSNLVRRPTTGFTGSVSAGVVTLWLAGSAIDNVS